MHYTKKKHVALSYVQAVSKHECSIWHLKLYWENVD